jgi:uncharacterized protein YyaL (SSP411 family)
MALLESMRKYLKPPSPLLTLVAPLAGAAVLAGWIGWPAADGTPSPQEPAITQHATTGKTNRLARESSPYLLLHKDNPVDWYPWGPEALEKARREDKPIFLSVGYSTCYWCHVMERESFSDPEIAALMNELFVNIKVDREERPDLDDIYLTATQILTGHGGWPNSVFLTPELEPFYAGTYFPPRDQPGRSGFVSVIRSLGKAWAERRDEIRQHADDVAATLGRFLEERVESSDRPPSPEVARRSLEALASSFDAEWGGFGSAPKFPTPSNLYLLLELAGRPARGGSEAGTEAESDDEAGRMLDETLDRMARGGIYDQLGGGFHRYSTDREWKVPHFEKMLYDNGFLLEIYAREHARTGDPEMARVARETAGWIAREMTSPQGALYSAIDAETDAREGAFYVWTRDELEQVLGAEDFEFLAPIYGFDGPPSFEGEEYVLHLPERLAEVARRRRMSLEELSIEMAPPTRKLFEARAERRRPLTDDKVLTGWNGIAIAGLAHAGRLLGEPEMVQQAAKAARFLLGELWPRTGTETGEAGERGPLLHTWRRGKARLPAFLSDYVFLVRGLLALHEATGEDEWLRSAAALTDEQIERLGDPRGGFFDAAAGDDLLFRTREVFDGALPAGNSVAALNLLTLADRLGGEQEERVKRFRKTAETTLEAFGGLVSSYPEAVRMMTVAARRFGAETPAGETPAGESPEASSPEASSAGMDAEAREVVGVEARLLEGAEGDWRPFRVELAIRDGWHVNAHPASHEFLIPTRVEGRGGEVRNVTYPEPRRLEASYADGGIDVYEGTVELAGELRGEPSLRVTYQACDAERCLRPVTVEVSVE